MANRLKVTARNWAAQVVDCLFTATADGKPLPTAAPSKPGYKIPPGTTKVILTAAPKTLDYWPTTITLSASSGVISPIPPSASIGGIIFPQPSAIVDVTAAAGETQVSIKMSRFKEVTTQVPVSKKSGTVPVGTVLAKGDELSKNGVLGFLQQPIPPRPSGHPAGPAPPEWEIIGYY